PPGAYATTDELAELANEAARLAGIYHTHVRYALGDRFLDPFREAIDIGRRGVAPAHITHFYHRATFPGTPDQMLALVDDARAEGLDVTFDAYPYEWASTRLLITVPPWVQAGGPGLTKERLADRAVRDRIRSELRERGVLYAGAGGIGEDDVDAGRASRAEGSRHAEGRFRRGYRHLRPRHRACKRHVRRAASVPGRHRARHRERDVRRREGRAHRRAARPRPSPRP